MRFVPDSPVGLRAAGACGSGGLCRGGLTDGPNFGRDTMPLLDHFHPPLAPRRHWKSFHVNWAGAIADALNESLLPEGYFAEEHAQLAPWVDTDVASFAASDPSGPRASSTATLPTRAWAPP